MRLTYVHEGTNYVGAKRSCDMYNGEITLRLAAYEDLTHDGDKEVISMDRLREICNAEREAAQWVEKASDNTEYVLSYAQGIYCVTDGNGSVVCEFIRDGGTGDNA